MFASSSWRPHHRLALSRLPALGFCTLVSLLWLFLPFQFPILGVVGLSLLRRWFTYWNFNFLFQITAPEVTNSFALMTKQMLCSFNILIHGTLNCNHGPSKTWKLQMTFRIYDNVRIGLEGFQALIFHSFNCGFAALAGEIYMKIDQRKPTRENFNIRSPILPPFIADS